MLAVAKESLKVRLVFVNVSLASSALRSCAEKRMGEGKTKVLLHPEDSCLLRGPMCISVKYLCSLRTVHSSSSEHYVLKESTWLKV